MSKWVAWVLMTVLGVIVSGAIAGLALIAGSGGGLALGLWAFGSLVSCATQGVVIGFAPAVDKEK